MARPSHRQRWRILRRKTTSLARRLRFSKTIPPEPILFRFPMELLLEVASYLPSPDHICLALSCKGLYGIFSSVLKAEELRFLM